MSMKFLGETIDLHGGGIDHIPVHHTNEIAQSEAATGKKFVRHWFHANHILVDGQKIAKSLGNGITLEDIEKSGFSALDLRMLALESHYRSQAQFTWDALAAARTRRLGLQAMADLRFQELPGNSSEEYITTVTEQLPAALLAALNDDLNTPVALAALSQAEAVLLEQYRSDCRDVLANLLELVDSLFGLNLLTSDDINTQQKKLMADRQQARQDQAWAKSDQLREHLKDQGIGIRDTSQGQVWYRL